MKNCATYLAFALSIFILTPAHVQGSSPNTSVRTKRANYYEQLEDYINSRIPGLASGPNKYVAIDFTVGRTGEISEIHPDKDDTADPSTREEAISKLKSLKTLPPSPQGSAALIAYFEPACINIAKQGVDYGPYMQAVQAQIKKRWHPPKGENSRSCTASFKIARDGTISDLRLASSTGTQEADESALKAVRDAAPFRPLPLGAPRTVDIEYAFDYNVFQGGEKI